MISGSMKPILASPDLTGLPEILVVFWSGLISALLSLAAVILALRRRTRRAASKWFAGAALLFSTIGVWPLQWLVSRELGLHKAFPGDNHYDMWAKTAAFFGPLFVAAVGYRFVASALEKDGKGNVNLNRTAP